MSRRRGESTMIDQLAQLGMTGLFGGLGGIAATVALQQVSDAGGNFLSSEVSQELDEVTVEQSNAFQKGDTVTFHSHDTTGTYRGVIGDKIALEVDGGEQKYLPLSAYKGAFTVEGSDDGE